MAFHVELRKSFHRARSFNLTREELSRDVLAPWVRGAPVDFGERRWLPSESELTVLDGPELDPGQLALGQGWNAATKTATDVTERILLDAATPPGVALFTDVETVEPTLATLLAALGLDAVAWPEARLRLGAGEARTRFSAALFALGGGQPTAQVAFELGLAIGSLGARRTVVATLAGDGAVGLDGLSTTPLDLRSASSLQGLGERLRLAGAPLRPTPGWDSPTLYVDR